MKIGNNVNMLKPLNPYSKGVSFKKNNNSVLLYDKNQFSNDFLESNQVLLEGPDPLDNKNFGKFIMDVFSKMLGSDKQKIAQDAEKIKRYIY